MQLQTAREARRRRASPSRVKRWKMWAERAGERERVQSGMNHSGKNLWEGGLGGRVALVGG
jgi:hypothetical protein